MPTLRRFRRDLRLHDPDGAYIRRWVREVDEDDYPETIVEHKAERADALRRYSKIT
jgi:deoxyribodipyrimidine photo-lyase